MVMCNHSYFDRVDADFGPLFIKFCAYFPSTARICLNGHEYVKRQLAKAGIAFDALDNGLRACADARRAQHILDDLTEEKSAALVATWLGRLPDPFTAADHAAGYNFQLSVLQADILPYSNAWCELAVRIVREKEEGIDGLREWFPTLKEIPDGRHRYLPHDPICHGG